MVACKTDTGANTFHLIQVTQRQWREQGLHRVQVHPQNDLGHGLG